MARLVKFWSQDRDDVPTVTVYTRASWDSGTPWVAIPNCYCASATQTTGGAIATAQLVFEYGRIQNAGADTFSPVSPLSIQGDWVKIEWSPNSGTDNFDFAVADATERALIAGDLIAGQIVLQLDDGTRYEWDGASWSTPGGSPTTQLETWYGIATDTNNEIDAPPSAGSILSGRQTITCMGPEWLLTRQQVITSYVENVAGVSTTAVKSGLPFNALRGDFDNEQHNQGNQSNTPDVNGIQIFAKTLDNPRKWNAKDIIEYLIAYHSPIDSGDLTVTLSAANNNMLSWYEPLNVVTHGRTLFDLINAVVPKSRGIFWWLSVDEGTDELVINVDSLLPSNVSLPTTGTTVNANSNQVDWNYEDVGMQASTRRDSIQKKYSRVTVEGARRGCVCSIGMGSGELVIDWDSADASAYATGASGEPGYPVDVSDQKRANDGKRLHDKVLHRVYTHFKINPNWDGRAGSGLSPPPTGSKEHFVLRAQNSNAEDLTVSGGNIVDESGDTIVLEDGSTPIALESDSSGYILDPLWVAGIKVENYLPLYVGYDYSNPASPSSGLPSGTAPEFMRPFATTAMLNTTSETLDNSKREFVDHLGSAAYLETATRGAGLAFNGRFRAMRNQPGIIIDSSAPPHVFALGNYNEGTAQPSSYMPECDYQKHAATVYLTFPTHVRVSIDADPAVEDHNHISEHVIRLGDRAHLDLIVKDTTVGLQGDAVIPASVSAYIRDDRQLLRDVAAMAWQWYQTPRLATRLTANFVTSQAKIGEMVLTESVSGDTLNSVVSEVVWDFRSGTTTIQTQFAELDFEGLV